MKKWITLSPKDAASVRPPAQLDPQWALLLLWRQKGNVLKMAFLFAVVGVVVALLSPFEYISEVRVMPELQARSALNLKRFGALAELAGINLEGVSNTEAIRPDLYPDVLKSTPFMLYLLNQPVTTVEKRKFPTLAAFLTEGSFSLIDRVFGKKTLSVPPALGDRQALHLTRDQEELVKNTKERILSDLDKQSGVIIIRVKMPDAEVAAQVGQLAIDYLTRYVISYRTEKTREDLKFLSERFREAKQRYDRAMINLSTYKDQHRYMVTQVGTIEERRLQADFELAQGLYGNITQQYEQTRIKIQEETPILKILEPPQVPTKRSEPRRSILVVLYTFIGGLVGIGLVLMRHIEWLPKPV
ncbi:GNVR domain-containing protein [Larkinella terrae]|uniref:Lipopolysaccharide biosynthesis protein n=1 Tax=Larkinella terrae TaxID=2025311 RepID=A0A7K0EGP2_9BACT|nr:GNVR domain-containing protein [Larkinella terrae]MRS60935.1 lipopolysaccharide biosynthesis protein [Larkinella terrae]